MKNACILLLISVFLLTATFAAAARDDDITVLDAETFIKVDKSLEGIEMILLFKVDGSRVDLVDAVQINEKTVNFKPLLQYRHLTIEEKESF